MTGMDVMLTAKDYTDRRLPCPRPGEDVSGIVRALLHHVEATGKPIAPEVSRLIVHAVDRSERRIGVDFRVQWPGEDGGLMIGDVVRLTITAEGAMSMVTGPILSAATTADGAILATVRDKDGSEQGCLLTPSGAVTSVVITILQGA